MCAYSLHEAGKTLRMLHGTTCSSFIQALQQAVPGLAAETLKVLVPKPKARNLQLVQDPELLLSTSGISPGMKVMLLGSFTSELQALQANKQAELSLRLPDFEHEAQRVAQRRTSRSSRAGDGPTGHHCFGSFDVLPLPAGVPGLAPPSSAALSLLHRIATDPAIGHVMTSHGWQVGVLSEMAPEGKVGVSAMCVLGYNVNKGQEISLRLRTDDYRGFRKYLRIRETLVHELAHMVYSEHDNDFKALNSQLLKEVAAHEAAASGGRTLAGAGVFDGDWLGQQQQEVPAAARGRAVGGGQSTAAAYSSSARQAAAAAALTRWQQQQSQQQQLWLSQQPGSSAEVAGAGGSDVVTSGSGPVPAGVLDQAMADADQASTATAAAATSKVTQDAGPASASEKAVAGGCQVDDGSLTEDPATAAAEVALRRLGSMDWPDDGQSLETPVQQPQQQQQVLPYPDTAAADVPMQSEMDVQPAQRDCSMPMNTLLISDLNAVGRQHQQQTVQASPLEVIPVAQETRAEVTDQSGHENGHITAIAVAANSSVGYHDDYVSVDDVVSQKLQQAQVLLQQLQQQANSSSQQTLQALEDVLSSITQHPKEQRYRRLRCGNAAFQRRLGQYPAAIQLLLLSGFAEQQLQWQGDGKPETVLVYVREDPGLLWLVLSAIRDLGRY